MYTTIIHPLRKAYNLSITEYCVLEAIRTLSNNTKYQGWCLMSQARIAMALDVSRQWMINVYRVLEAKGLIERRKESPQDTAVRTVDEWNEWFMSDKADILLAMKTKNNEVVTIMQRNQMRELSTSKPEGVSGLRVNKVYGGSKQSLRGGSKQSLHNTNNINTKKILNTPLPPKGNDEGFEKFWKQYPNKKGKLNTQKAWAKLSPVDRSAAMEALPFHISSEPWAKDSGRFIPHPATWLNGRRFEDEIAPPALDKDQEYSITVRLRSAKIDVERGWKTQEAFESLCLEYNRDPLTI